MSDQASPREDYLARLEDLLPAHEIARVRADVEDLILERASGEGERDPSLSPLEAERNAIAALGPAERLAEELASAPLTIPLATRRTFVRLLAAVFACHLLLSIAMAVAGSTSAAIPGVLGPLPQGSFGAILLSVITIFLIDTGALLVVFVAMGKARPEQAPRILFRSSPWTRRGAIEGLVLLALLAVLFNGYLEQIFAIQHGDSWSSFLAQDFLSLVPYINVVFALFALRHILTLLGKGDSTWSLGADAAGSLAGSAFMIMGATRRELVQMPSGHKLGQEAAEVLDNLIESVFLIVFVVGALLLIMRFVRQGIAMARRIRS